LNLKVWQTGVFMKIAVIGSGYVGLVASSCLADMDHHVCCVDCDAAKIEQLRAGGLPIHEPGLQELVARGISTGRLTFGTDLAAAVGAAKIVFIAVGTPDGNGDGKPDLSSVFTVAADIARALRGYCAIVTKSTVPVGTGDVIERILAAHCSRAFFDVVSNPEFLREGRAIHDFKNPERIVIGTKQDRAQALMARLYAPAHFGRAPVLFTSRHTAELMKYAANAFLALKVAFINDVAELCEYVGADVEDVTHGMGLDVRIGREFLRPGPGFGGSCLPKDTRALVQMAQECGAPRGLFEAIVTANQARKDGLAKRVISACGGSVRGLEIALLGLTFKSDTDDMRESPAVPLIAALQANGAQVRAYDPAGMKNAARIVDGVKFINDPYTCVRGAHAIVLLTDWLEFQQLDLRRLRQFAAEPLLIDFRNMLDPANVARSGLTYVSVGRNIVVAKRKTRRSGGNGLAMPARRASSMHPKAGDARLAEPAE
jgi:UDPglucose 6-dehydrogenase